MGIETGVCGWALEDHRSSDLAACVVITFSVLTIQAANATGTTCSNLGNRGGALGSNRSDLVSGRWAKRGFLAPTPKKFSAAIHFGKKEKWIGDAQLRLCAGYKHSTEA